MQLSGSALEGGLLTQLEEASADPLLQRAAGWGGSALSLVLCLAAARRGARELPLVVAVGDAVRRGLPTAARATVAGVAPLSGRYVDAQLGGSLARRLARNLEAVALSGRTELAGAVLLLDERGEPRLEACPELLGLGLHARAALLRERHPGSGGLVVGPAADRGVAFASLANLSDPPSYAGRGGLGARFAATGLMALVVSGEPVEASVDAERLRAELVRSPRLLARGEGGTFELLGAFAARGDLRSRSYREQLSAEEVRELERSAARASLERLACSGCPTACRHVVERARGEERSRHGARFSATYALGSNLGLGEFEDSLELLAICDDLGVDARDAGAALALLAEARERGMAEGPPLWGDVRACAAELRALGSGGSSQLAGGAGALARELGLEQQLREARGLSARPVSSLAGVLGQCVCTRGADPMRAFPFLAESGGDTEGLAALLAPLELSEQAFDPRSPSEKGRLVWWHENLAAMIDATGFCAFSAAGLVADGLWDLDRLARELAPAGCGHTGRGLLAAGATLVLLQRELEELLSRDERRDLPAWAAEQLSLPGMYDEYAALRGLDADGRVSAAARALLGSEELLDLGVRGLAPRAGAPAQQGRGEPRPGEVLLRSYGSLSSALGGERREACALPIQVRALLEQLAAERPGSAELIRRAGVHRAGRRLAAGDWIETGDVLDLVLAISGG